MDIFKWDLLPLRLHDGNLSYFVGIFQFVWYYFPNYEYDPLSQSLLATLMNSGPYIVMNSDRIAFGRMLCIHVYIGVARGARGAMAPLFIP